MLDILFIALAIYIGINFRNWIGAKGERFVISKLNELDPKSYTVLNDLLIPSSGGRTETTQIDHVVVSLFGIFCIETKSHSGWIFGDAQQKLWRQIIYSLRYPIYNPIWQNFAHIKALESIVHQQFPNIRIQSLVAFPMAGRLRIHNTDEVSDGRGTLNRIKKYTNQIISEDQRNQIVQLLLQANILDKKVRKLHLQQVKRLKHYSS